MLVNPRHRPSFFPVFVLLMVAMLLIVDVPASQALKPGEVSLYAEVEAGYRAVAAQDPDEKIRKPDHEQRGTGRPQHECVSHHVCGCAGELKASD